MEHGAVLRHLLHNVVLAIKVHHFQAHKRLIGQLRIEKAHLEELYSHFILADLGIHTFPLGRYLDIEHRQTVTHIHAELVTLVLRLHTCIGVADITLHAVLAHNAELSGHIIELANQLNAEVYDLCVGSVCRLGAVLAALAAGFLQCRNSRGRSYTGADITGAGLCVAAGLSQLLDGTIQESDIIGIQSVVLDPTQRHFVQIAFHIYQRIAQIQELSSIYTTVLALVVSRNSTNHGILYEGGVHQVNDRLRIAADINIAIAAGATLNGEKSIKYIRILAMLI